MNWVDVPADELRDQLDELKSAGKVVVNVTDQMSVMAADGSNNIMVTVWRIFYR